MKVTPVLRPHMHAKPMHCVPLHFVFRAERCLHRVTTVQGVQEILKGRIESEAFRASVLLTEEPVRFSSVMTPRVHINIHNWNPHPSTLCVPFLPH